MKNMFFYTRKEALKTTEGEEPKYVNVTDSFNMNKVIRSIGLDDGRIVVLLDDIHQRPQWVDKANKKGEITARVKEMTTFQSEIFLEKEDAIRFYQLTNIES